MRAQVWRVSLLIASAVLVSLAGAEELQVSVKSTAMVSLGEKGCPANSCCTVTGTVLQACPLAGGSCCGSSGFCCPVNYQCGSALLQQPSCILKAGPVLTPTQTRSVVYVGGTKTMNMDYDLGHAVENALFRRPTYVTAPRPAAPQPEQGILRAINVNARGFGPAPMPSLSSTTFVPSSDAAHAPCFGPQCIAAVPSAPSECQPCSGAQQPAPITADACSGAVVPAQCAQQTVTVPQQRCCNSGSSSSSSSSSGSSSGSSSADTIAQLSALSASLASESSAGTDAFHFQLREIAQTLNAVLATLLQGDSLSQSGSSSGEMASMKGSLSQSASALSSALSAMSSTLASSESGQSSKIAKSLSSISSVLSSLSSSSALSSALSGSSSSSASASGSSSSRSSSGSASASSGSSSKSKSESSASAVLSSMLSALSSASASRSGSKSSSSSSSSSGSSASMASESSLLSSLSESAGPKPPRKLLITILRTVIAQLEAASLASESSGEGSLSAMSNAISSLSAQLSSEMSGEDRQSKRARSAGLVAASAEKDGSGLTVKVKMGKMKKKKPLTKQAAARAAAIEKLKFAINEIGKRIPAVSNPVANVVPANPAPAGYVKPIDPTDYWKWEEPYSALPVRRMQRCGPWDCNEWMRPDQIINNAKPQVKQGPKMHFEVPVHVAINRPLQMTKTVTNMVLKSGKRIKAITRTLHHTPVRTVTVTKVPSKNPVIIEKDPPPPPLFESSESVAPVAKPLLASPTAPKPAVPVPKPRPKPAALKPKPKTKVNQHVELNIGRPILEDV